MVRFLLDGSDRRSIRDGDDGRLIMVWYDVVLLSRVLEVGVRILRDHYARRSTECLHDE